MQNQQVVAQVQSQLAQLPLYRDPRRVERDVVGCLLRLPDLKTDIQLYVADDGTSSTMLRLHGLVAIDYRRNTYYIPISIWMVHDFPARAPICYVTPTSHMRITKNHPHVDPNGLVSLPYLQAWAAQSGLEELLGFMASVFSALPPVYAVAAAAQPAPQPQLPVAQPHQFQSQQFQFQQPAGFFQPPQPPQPQPQQPHPYFSQPMPANPPHPQHHPHHPQQPGYPGQRQHQPPQSQFGVGGGGGFAGQQPMQPGQAEGAVSPPVFNPYAAGLGPGAAAGVGGGIGGPVFAQPVVQPGSGMVGGVGGAGQQGHGSPAEPASPQPPAQQPPQSAAVTRAQHKDDLVKQLTERLRTRLHDFEPRANSELDTLREDRDRLQAGSQVIENGLQTLSEERARLRAAIGEMDDRIASLQAWLGQHERKTQEPLDALACVQYGDVWSEQLVEAVTKDHAQEDTLFALSQSLANDRLELPEFLRLVRKTAESQYYARALATRIQEKLDRAHQKQQQAQQQQQSQPEFPPQHPGYPQQQQQFQQQQQQPQHMLAMSQPAGFPMA